MNGRNIKTKLTLGLGFILLGFASFYLVKQLHRKYLIDQEIQGLKDEIATLEGKNKEILELMSYLESSEYKERQARSLLNLQKPGEFAVVLPANDSGQGEQQSETKQSKSSNLKKWWDYFFAR